MKASQFFISTLKEAPAEAELPSHKLMLRAGLIKRVAHMQRTSHIGWGQLYGEVVASSGSLGTGQARAAIAGVAGAALFPLGAPMGFDGSGFKRLGEAVEAGLLNGVAHGCGAKSSENENGIRGGDAVCIEIRTDCQ